MLWPFRNRGKTTMARARCLKLEKTLQFCYAGIMVVYIFRHGIAEDSNPKGDSERSLTKEGEKKVKAVTAFLAKTIKPAVILSSPYRRARQTAALASEFLGNVKVEVSNALFPNTEPDETVVEINAQGAEEIMLVGHDPHLSDLLSWLVCGEYGLFSLKKSGIAAVEFQGKAEAGRGTLKWLLSPGLIG